MDYKSSIGGNMKLGPVIDKMMKKNDSDMYEKDIKPLLTITISQGDKNEEEEEEGGVEE